MSKIAVIGMSCRLPGARNVDEYWHVLSHHQEAFVEVPSTRWDWRQYYSAERKDNPICFNKAGFIPELEYFDGSFFGLDAVESQRLDPQQRVILELVWEALESACIIPSSLSGTGAAVVMGVGHNDHARKLKNDFPTFNGAVGLHSYDCFVANRVSYFLNLKGPSFVVNSACSSSLHAIHLACNMLRDGETQLAICGGVNVNLLPDESVDSTLAHWLTPTGHCRSFSEGGDGFVRSEGAGVVILKRLEDAVADGDPVLGVIRGSALGHNGQSNGISVPNGDAQKQLIRRCFANAALSPGDIDYVEAHGTGSSKGDSTEALNLIDVLGSEATGKRVFVGCCKPNIGHTEAASGVAGLIKVLLCLKHGKLPRISNLEKLNRWIPEHPAFSPLWQDEAWLRADRPRRAGLANYAFGGANAFFIVEEHVATPTSLRPLPHRFAFISARSEAELKRLSDTLCAAMPRLSDDEFYTLNCCREHHAYRNIIFDNGANGIINYRQHMPSVADIKVSVHLDAAQLAEHTEVLLSYIQESAYLSRSAVEFASATGIVASSLVAKPAQACRYLAAFWVWVCRRAHVPVSLFVTSTDIAFATLIRPENVGSEAVSQWIMHGSHVPDHGPLQRARRNGTLADVGDVPDEVRTFCRFDLLSIWLEPATTPGSTGGRSTRVGADMHLINSLITCYLAGHRVQLAPFLRGNKVSMPSVDPFEREYTWFTPSIRIVSKSSVQETQNA